MSAICHSQGFFARNARRYRWWLAAFVTAAMSGCAPLPTEQADAPSTPTTPRGAQSQKQAEPAKTSRWNWWRHEQQTTDSAVQSAPATQEKASESEADTSAQTSEPPRNSDQKGVASWYGPGFHGRLTANGERFNQHELTAAHRTFKFGTRVCVRSSVNGKTVVVRINDRGPYAKGRVIDLSHAAAKELGMMGLGVKPVELWALEDDEEQCPGEDSDADSNSELNNAGLSEGARQALLERGIQPEAAAKKPSKVKVTANKAKASKTKKK